MVSLISIILNLFGKRNIIQIRRLPPIKVLRAHQLGLTLALFCAILAIILNFTSLFTGLPLYISLLFIVIFALGTIMGSPFIIIVALYLLFYDGTAGIWATLYTTLKWYIAGYVFGAILAILYNDLVFLYTITFGKRDIKIAFFFNPDKKFNIIKSPCKNEQHEGFTKYDLDRKLYNYKLKSEPEHPYTIVFAANPCIWNEEKKKYEKDPIIDNLDLFLSSVDRALFSFEQDEVLGRPEIWSRVRIVTFFDGDLADVDLTKKSNAERLALVEPFKNIPEIDGKVAENLLAPGNQMWENYKDMLENINMSEVDRNLMQKTVKETDVIYALSASHEYIRSTANYSDWKSEGASNIIDNRPGREFEFESDTSSIKKAKHDEYAFLPGRVALNVLGATIKTYIHEFGHAMSSAINGAIVDEYFDTFKFVEPEQTEHNNSNNGNKPFYVNRIERPNTVDGEIHPVPMIFAKYDQTIFYSDLNHPSAEEEWLGYFPARITPYATCTMDRTYGNYRFDRLLSRFIYDRLITKINRKNIRSKKQ